jgi:hypothetical protein
MGCGSRLRLRSILLSLAVSISFLRHSATILSPVLNRGSASTCAWFELSKYPAMECDSRHRSFSSWVSKLGLGERKELTELECGRL